MKNDYGGSGIYYYNVSAIHSQQVNQTSGDVLHSNLVSDGGGISNEKEKFKIIISIVSIICVVLNSYTIVVVFQPKKLRPVNYLIANLSLICILCSMVGLFYFGDGRFTGIWLCGILSYTRNLVVSLLSLTVLGLSYERVQSLKPRLSKMLISRTIFCIWTTAFVCTTPTFFTSVYFEDEDSNGICKKVPLLGIMAIEVFFESLRFLLFHGIVCGFMIFELYKVRSKLKYMYLFKKIPNHRIQEKVRRVRFIYLFSIIFILIWIPFGMFLSFYKTLRRKSNLSMKTQSTLLGYITISFYMYILVCPLVILWANTEPTKRKWLFCCKQLGSPQTNEGPKIEGENTGGSTLSRGCTITIAKTSHSISVPNLYTKSIGDIESKEIGGGSEAHVPRARVNQFGRGHCYSVQLSPSEFDKDLKIPHKTQSIPTLMLENCVIHLGCGSDPESHHVQGEDVNNCRDGGNNREQGSNQQGPCNTLPDANYKLPLIDLPRRTYSQKITFV